MNALLSQFKEISNEFFSDVDRELADEFKNTYLAGPALFDRYLYSYSISCVCSVLGLLDPEFPPDVKSMIATYENCLNFFNSIPMNSPIRSCCIKTLFHGCDIHQLSHDLPIAETNIYKV